MDKTQKIILSVVALLLCAAVTCAIFLIIDRTKFSPPEPDREASNGTPSVDLSAYSYQSVHVTDGFDVSLCANPLLDGDRLHLYFTNAETNRGLMLVTVSDSDGNELGRSGTVCPGQYFPAVRLTTLPNGEQKLKVKIITYEPDTYYSLGTATVLVHFTNE